MSERETSGEKGQVLLRSLRPRHGSDGNTSSSASVLLTAITQFAFLAAMSSAEFVLNYTKPLSVLLQKSGLDLCAASCEFTIVRETLNDVRLSADERFAGVYANI